MNATFRRVGLKVYFPLNCSPYIKLQYEYITYEQRYIISYLIKEGYNQSNIARAIGISREIECNQDKRSGEYWHGLAHEKYCSRNISIAKYTQFT